MSETLLPFIWKDDVLSLLDQRKLPHREEWIHVRTPEICYQAIQEMVVRGAPCISFVAMFGLALWSHENPDISIESWRGITDWMKTARPTAVNLVFEIEKLYKIGEAFISRGEESLLYKIIVTSTLIAIESLYQTNLTCAQLAFAELNSLYSLKGKRPLRILTHCNTGPLACGVPLGTALGVVFYLHEQGQLEKVWVDETRPYLQGGRLTSYELLKKKIPHQVIVDGASSLLMREGLVDAVFVGADRIVANGDTANKIGTSNLAIVAKHYDIPFYVVAPLSSFDLSLASGKDIHVELRNEDEILSCDGQRIAAQGISAYNPSFDITPGELIKLIICERGAFRPDDLKKSLTGILM